jgi:glyoxylase-like metal-dependent hydrolase (beta-lactamase superfamily II)
MSWNVDEGIYFENISLIDSNLLGTQKLMCFYIIKGEKETAMIDSPGPLEVESFSKKFSTMGIKPDVLILTHSHWDHAAGTYMVQERYPDIEVMVGTTGLNSLKLNSKFNDNFNNFKDLPPLEPIEDLIPLNDGDIIDLGGPELLIIETPGHTNCSISIFEQEHKVLFIGDALGNILTLDFIMPTIMPPEFSEVKLFLTIDKIKTIDYSALAFPHYGILTGEIAENFPNKAKSSYLKWCDFLIATWKEKKSKEFSSKKFAEKLYSLGFNDAKNIFPFEMFGGWMIDGLKAGDIL